jgi:hypothetical protein
LKAIYLVDKWRAREDGMPPSRSFAQKKHLASLPDDKAAIIERGSLVKPGK